MKKCINYKCAIGYVILVVGLVLIAFGFYQKNRLGKAKSTLSGVHSILPKNPIDSAVSGVAADKIRHYENLILGVIIGGFVIAAGGVVTVISGRK